MEMEQIEKMMPSTVNAVGIQVFEGVSWFKR